MENKLILSLREAILQFRTEIVNGYLHIYNDHDNLEVMQNAEVALNNLDRVKVVINLTRTRDEI